MKKLLLIFLFASFVSLQAKVEVSQQGEVLIIKINNSTRNAVSTTVLKEINLALNKAEENENIGAVVITGRDEVFSAGAGGESIKGTPKGEKTHAMIAHETFFRIESFPKPIIAAVRGFSGGGGNELALACDIRIAGENAKFRQHELQAGFIPGFGGMQRLPRLIGQSRAMEMMLTGRAIDAKEALSFGLVSRVVSDDKVIDEAVKLAKQLIENLDKKALAVFKSRMGASYNESFKEALKNDQIAFDKLALSPHIKVAIKRFIEKQKALSKK